MPARTRHLGTNALIELLRSSRRAPSTFEQSLVRERDGTLRSRLFRGIRFSPQALAQVRAKFLAPKVESRLFKALKAGKNTEKILARLGDEKVQQSYLRAIKKRSPTSLKKDDTGKYVLVNTLQSYKLSGIIVRPAKIVSVTVSEPSLTRVHIWRDAMEWELGLREYPPSKFLNEIPESELQIFDLATNKKLVLENDIEKIRRLIKPGSKQEFAKSARKKRKYSRSPRQYVRRRGKAARSKAVRTARGH